MGATRKLKCGRLVRSEDAASVRRGFELGGYVVAFCAEHSPKPKPPEAADALAPLAAERGEATCAKIAQVHPAPPAPVEIWHDDRKVTIDHEEVIRVWGPGIETQMSSEPRSHESVNAAVDWLYAHPAPPAPAAMPGVEIAEAVRAGWRAVRGRPVGGGDGQTYEVPPLTQEVMQQIATAILALSSRLAQENERLKAASLHHETGERISRKNLNDAFRQGQENGRMAAHLIDGVSVDLKPGWLKRDTAKAVARVTELDSVAEYVGGYEFRGDQDYTPNAHEKALIEDAINGYAWDAINAAEARALSAEQAGRIAGLKEAAEIARHFPAAGKFEDGRFVAGPNTPYAIATAILARAGDAEKEG